MDFPGPDLERELALVSDDTLAWSEEVLPVAAETWVDDRDPRTREQP